MILINKIRRICLIPDIEKNLIVQSCLLFALFNLIIRIFPIRFYYSIIKSNPKSDIVSFDKSYAIKLLNKTIKRSCRLSLWSSNCLIQVMVLKVLCNKLGLKSEITFTVFNNYSSAHASIVIENDLSYFGLNNPVIILRKNQ